MTRTAETFAQCLVWLVAIMLPVQPLAAQNCSCSLADSNHSTVGAEESTNGQQSGCARGCCSHSHQPAKDDYPARVPFAPCNCPASCPCHLQHAAKPPLKAEEVEIQQAELIVWLVIAPAQTVTVVEFKQLQLVHKNAIIPGDSALEFCAALCRFTI